MQTSVIDKSEEHNNGYICNDQSTSATRAGPTCWSARRTTGSRRLEKLFETMRAAQVRNPIDIKVDRASARRAARGQKAFAGRETRTAHSALRWNSLALPIPQGRQAELSSEPVRLTLVHLREDTAPSGGERIEWLLITTWPVGTVKQAQEVVALYALRWHIEEYHRILTSGCDVEKIVHITAERVKRAVTINAVIIWAWRS